MEGAYALPHCTVVMSCRRALAQERVHHNWYLYVSIVVHIVDGKARSATGCEQFRPVSLSFGLECKSWNGIPEDNRAAIWYANHASTNRSFS